METKPIQSLCGAKLKWRASFGTTIASGLYVDIFSKKLVALTICPPNGVPLPLGCEVIDTVLCLVADYERFLASDIFIPDQKNYSIAGEQSIKLRANCTAIDSLRNHCDGMISGINLIYKVRGSLVRGIIKVFVSESTYDNVLAGTPIVADGEIIGVVFSKIRQVDGRCFLLAKEVSALKFRLSQPVFKKKQDAISLPIEIKRHPQEFSTQKLQNFQSRDDYWREARKWNSSIRPQT